MKLRTAFLLVVLVLAMSACGPRGSGYAPAENAVTASPDDDIDLQPHDYTLPAAEEAEEGLSSTYATGDSSGGANRTMSTVDVDALPMGTGDGHGDEGGHGEEAEHSAEAEEGDHAEDSETMAEGSSEEGSEETSAEADSETEETTAETSEAEETTGAMTEASEASASAGGEAGTAAEKAKELAAIQSRSSELSQELRDLDKQSEALKRDLLMAQIDAASLANVRGTYVVQEGDTVEAIANSFYGDSERGDAILEANRDLLEGAGEIFPGLVLLIPNLERSGSSAAPSSAPSEAEASETEEDAATETEAAVTEEETSEEAQSEDEPEDVEGEEDGEEDTEETSEEADVSEAVVADFDWQELGEKTYSANCVACHQANGEGIPGAFPPLAGHIPNLYNAEGGRDYIIQTVLYGLMGEVEINGTTYNGVMTPWGQLSDEQIAATLNHELNSWGNSDMLEDFSPILPDDVAALRNQNLSSSDVLELRPELP